MRRRPEEIRGRVRNGWLVTHRKTPAGRRVSVDQFPAEPISFGLIDGVRRKPDENRRMLIIGLRRTGKRGSEERSV